MVNTTLHSIFKSNNLDMEKIENVIKISGIHHAKGGGEQIIIASIKEGG